MPSRLDTRQLIVRAVGRVRTGASPVTLAALAAALAWLVAHRLLGHTQPFFAPIAAAISISTSPIQRSRRIVQMVGGVLLGIGIGELLTSALGTSTVALGVIVFLTMSAALLSGEGVFGEGMMFANQAAASAILVVTLHRAGTGSERAVDALIGGGVALVLGVGLFPAHPLKLLRSAEEAVLRALSEVLEELRGFVRGGDRPSPDYALSTGHRVHQLLATLARARSTARANVRVAPRRWRLRAAVDAEIERTARLDLLANAVLSLLRATTSAERRGQQLHAALEPELGTLASVTAHLASTPPPWPPEFVAASVAEVRRAGEEAAAHGIAHDPVVATILRAVATDLKDVITGEPDVRGVPAHQI